MSGNGLLSTPNNKASKRQQPRDELYKADIAIRRTVREIYPWRVLRTFDGSHHMSQACTLQNKVTLFNYTTIDNSMVLNVKASEPDQELRVTNQSYAAGWHVSEASERTSERVPGVLSRAEQEAPENGPKVTANPSTRARIRHRKRQNRQEWYDQKCR